MSKKHDQSKKKRKAEGTVPMFSPSDLDSLPEETEIQPVTIETEKRKKIVSDDDNGRHDDLDMFFRHKRVTEKDLKVLDKIVKRIMETMGYTVDFESGKITEWYGKEFTLNEKSIRKYQSGFKVIKLGDHTYPPLEWVIRDYKGSPSECVPRELEAVTGDAVFDDYMGFQGGNEFEEDISIKERLKRGDEPWKVVTDYVKGFHGVD